jgi:hypothetical protein
VPLQTPAGDVVEIDEEMVPLIRQLWRLGYTTHMCCQDAGEAIIGGGLTHVHESLRETTAARNKGRALVKLASDQGPALLTVLRSLYDGGLWLASISVGPDGPSCWVSIGFPRDHIVQATNLLCVSCSAPPRR